MSGVKELLKGLLSPLVRENGSCTQVHSKKLVSADPRKGSRRFRVRRKGLWSQKILFPLKKKLVSLFIWKY